MMSRKEEILQIAFQLLLEKGPDALSMRKVAGAASLTAMALYRHFENKEALLRTMSEKVESDLLIQLRGCLNARRAQDRFEQATQLYVRFALENRTLYPLLFSAKEQFESQNPILKFFTNRVHEAIRAGYFKSADLRETAFSLWAHLHGMILLHIHHQSGLNEEQFRKSCLKALGNHLSE